MNGLAFDGETFDPDLDGRRLERQLDRVLELMRDGQARTLAEIAGAVGGSEAGVSARLRDLRKTKFGGYRVRRERVGAGLFMYSVAPREPQPRLWH